MKEAAKAFLTITALLIEAFCVWEGMLKEGTLNPETGEIIFGLLLIAGALTAIWLHYSKRVSN